MSRSAACLLACLASPLLAAERPPLLAASDAILNDNEVSASVSFLAQKSLQDQLKAQDPRLFLKTFERAAELKDLADLLNGPAAEDDVVRMGLSRRPQCAFCQKPSEMEKWAAREFGLDEVRRLEAVYWDWKTLSDSQRGWLSAGGATPENWEASEFGTRRARLQGWAVEEAKVLLAFNPSTPKEHEELVRRSRAVEGVLGRTDHPELRDHANQAQVIVDQIADAQERLAGTKDTLLLGALKEAQTASTPEARLAALQRIFDGLGRPAAGAAAPAPVPAPAQAGQNFDARSRRFVAEIIASGVMRETQGTWAGKELQDFYATHPLTVAVAPLEGRIALYKNERLTFNERYIEDYVKSLPGRRTLDDLTTDPELAKPLVFAFVPFFVHEATHQEQADWARKQGLPLWSGEGVEAEAMLAEGVFFLQKSKIDPSYRRFVERNKDTLPLVREELADANRMSADGADVYGPEVMNTHYPEGLSIAGQAWSQILWHNDISGALSKELDRREKLPPDARAALETRVDSTVYDSREAFEKNIGAFGTAQLRAGLLDQQKQSRLAVEAYDLYSARLKSAMTIADERLRELDAQPDKVPGEVPSPSGK